MSAALGAVVAGDVARVFRRPVAFAVLALVTTFMAVLFMLLVIQFLGRDPAQPTAGVTYAVLVPYFNRAAELSLLLVPILTMGLVSVERRDGRLRHLFSLPVSSFDLVIGRLAGALALTGAMFGAIVLVPLTLLWGAPVDLGVYATNLVGLALFLLMHLCLGLMVSTMTAQPVLAGAVTLLVSLALWFADWANRLDPEASVVGAASTLSRLRGFAIGVVNVADVVYFLAAAGAFVALAVWRLEGERRHA